MNSPVKLAEIARIADNLADMCGDDERLFADMLDGESDIHRIIGKLHNQISLDGEMVTGISERQVELVERKARYVARMAASKSAIGLFLRAGKLAKIELPEATYSVRDGKPSLRIVDADAVPADLCRTKVEPDKTAINEIYSQAEALPNWLTREPAKDVVTARTK